MTDAQITALCPGGNPPAFEPVKKATKADPHAADEKWNRGRRGGVVHISRNTSAEHILAVCKATDGDLLREKARAIEAAGMSDGTKIRLAPIDKATASEIERVCGIAPKNLSPTIDGNEIRHTFNRHGKGRERDKHQSPITAADFERIPEIIAKHDSIQSGNPDNQTGSPTVRFVKIYPDGTNCTVFVVAETLAYKTMWKKKG